MHTPNANTPRQASNLPSLPCIPSPPVRFSADGKLLASASWDKTVRLWDLETKTTIDVIPATGHDTQLSFSSCGTQLVTDKGILNLKQHTLPSNTLGPDRQLELAVVNHWITVGGKRLFWLPADCRPEISAFRHNCVTVGTRSGKVRMIEFEPKEIPF